MGAVLRQGDRAPRRVLASRLRSHAQPRLREPRAARRALALRLHGAAPARRAGPPCSRRRSSKAPSSAFAEPSVVIGVARVISVVSAVRDLGRLREITSVLVRHGFGEVVARAGFGRKPRKAAPASDPPPPCAGADDAPEISTDELAKGEEEKTRTSTAERIRLVLQDLGPVVHQARSDRVDAATISCRPTSSPS